MIRLLRSRPVLTAYVLTAHLILASTLTACLGPRSEVEVFHLRDMVRDGQTEYLSELINALGSPSEEVRSAAINSLAELGEVAEPRLKQAIREENVNSGPALLALGKSGSTDALGVLREYRDHPTLGASAQEAERAIERKLYARVQTGEIEAMEAYLDAFPDSDKNETIRKARRARLSKTAYDQISQSPSVPALEGFLQEYSDTEDAPMAKVLLARLLVKEAMGSIDLEEYTKARATLQKVIEVDARRESEVKRLVAQSYLNEGRTLKLAGKDAQALKALEQASSFPELHFEADRQRADILLTQGRAKLNQSLIRQGVVLAEQAALLDPARRPEVLALKASLSSDFQAKMSSSDATTRRMGLVGMVSLGDEAIKPMELYLGNLFVRKEYAGVEEVVVALAESRKSAPEGSSNAGADRVVELLTEYLKTALMASSADMTRLFGSPEFVKIWTAELNPLDPRQYPTVFKVEELSTRHLGLSRIGLSVRILLGDSGMEVVKGSLLSDDEARLRLSQGQIGQDPGLAMLTRTQLCARFSSLMGELRRTAEKQPALFMEYAVGLTVPPTTSSDWLLVAEGYKRVVEQTASGRRLPANQMAGGLRSDRTALVSLDFDQRSLTLQVYDPIVVQLLSATPEAQAEAMARTLSAVLNSARSAYGLYSSIERYTILVGSAELSADTGLVNKTGRFEPETRIMLSAKNFAKIDWTKLRQLNGLYGPVEAGLVDLQWNRWSK